MFLKIFLSILMLFNLFAPSWATIIYVSGDQTGTWSADTVIVTDEVRVPPGQNLTVLPGVEVLFPYYNALIVDSAAILLAVGTTTDSIRFDALPLNDGWHGIRFLSASDSSRLEHCYLAHGYSYGSGEDNKGGAIYLSGCNPNISNNTICESLSGWGSGIYCKQSNPTVSNNIICGNSATYGAGISCADSSSPIISGNIITGNSATYGAGISCMNNSNPSISGNIITGNLATYGYGGGIYCDVSSPLIIGNIINENSGCWGGGIFCADGNPLISNNSICENIGGGGGGIYFDNSIPTISSNTLSGNSANDGGGIWCYNSMITIVNCIFWRNNHREIYNFNGASFQVTYCDIQDTMWPGTGNISIDPLFVNPENGDYHLQSTVGSFHGGSWLADSLYSPCIDAGDPSSPFALEPMPNGGRINMGFEGNTAEASLSTSSLVPLPITELPREFCLHAPYPNPFNPITTLSYSLPVSGIVDFTVFDITGRKVMTLTNGFSQSGNHRVMFDGSDLASGIYFARFQCLDAMQTRKMVLVK